jgi:hypothetical protein
MAFCQSKSRGTCQHLLTHMLAQLDVDVNRFSAEEGPFSWGVVPARVRPAGVPGMGRGGEADGGRDGA